MNESYDALIIGGGLTGLLSAWVLKKQQINVAIVEKNSKFPVCFKAEKIEADQALLLKKFGLLDARRPYNSPIGKISCYKYGKLKTVDTIEQYGIRYHDFVNQVRKQVEEIVPIIQAKVDNIETTSNLQTLHLSDNQQLQSRLVIIGTGGTGVLTKKLAMQQIPMSDQPEMRSFSLGFDIIAEASENFNFNGFNYFCNPIDDQIDYLTLFLIDKSMRANIFTHWKVKDPRVKAFMNNPEIEMKKYFPRLTDFIGKFKVSTRVECFPTQYYQLDNIARDGVVVLADEFQSVNPTTGTGLSKVTNDVDILCNRYLPKWLETSGMGCEKIIQFYNDSDKQAIDNDSSRKWKSAHNKAHNTSLKWNLVRNNWLNVILGRD